MNNRKLINIVKGDIQNAINNGDYARNTERNSNIEFDTKNKQILLDGVPYSNPLMVETTYNELKTLRDNSQLVPGSFYRITDYNCTTTQENTKSAGHQFDIVLLAISENKLAEESWAMEHPTDVYDVICTDNIIIKCYYYTYYDEEEKINLVNVDTLLGNSGYPEDYEGIINHETKTITPPVDSATLLNSLSQENLTYNYFQNSNLSAWKVWYCLDNDKSRFAWADDSVDEDVDSFITISNDPGIIYYYKSSVPGGKHLWESSGDAAVYTDSETPENRDTVYNYQKRTGYSAIGEVTSYTPAHEGTGLPNGRGVIYRLIDEWMNDVGYDFKNIQFVRPLTDGDYDPDNGVDGWVYTFHRYDSDGSIPAPDGEGGFQVLNKGNIIKASHANSLDVESVVVIDCNGCYFEECGNITASSCSRTKVLDSWDLDLQYENTAIYIANKKVLTEE